MKKINFFIGAVIFITAVLAGCGVFENIVESPPVVDVLGLDYSACVGDGFDVCLEFLLDNDEALLGQDAGEWLSDLLESVNSNGIATISAEDL